MLAIPLLLLYEGALAVMWFTERKEAREKAAEEPVPEAPSET
jgi:sec-independent protein translocase protein TatC